MIHLSALIFLMFGLTAPPDFNLEKIRDCFYKATEDRKAAEMFKKELKDVGEKEPVLMGYKGMSEMILASHSYNPVNKISYFNAGKELLEKAIKSDPASAELRFLRFSVQTNAPFFLGYRTNLEEDKVIILKYLLSPKQDEDLGRRMKEFVLQSRYYSEKEKNLIK